MMKKLLMSVGILAISYTVLGASGCDTQPTATEVEAAKQEQMTKQAVETVGMPAIVNFQEKRVLKQILELRDTKLSTITYIMDMQGRLHKICDSIGYGIPYATQYTNPNMLTDSYGNYTRYVMPQADPNGLYSPAAAEGTWVLCSNPGNKDGEVSPTYIEPRIIVSTFPLDVK